MSTPVIVLYTHTVGLAVIRSLGARGIPIVAVSYRPGEVGQYSKYVQARVRVRHPKEDELGFIDDVLGLVEHYSGALLVPTDDYTLVAVSRHRARLSRHFRVCAEAWPLVEGTINKQAIYELAARAGIPCPKSFRPADASDVIDAVGQLDLPCLVKPCESHIFYDRFKAKMFRVDTLDECLARFQQCADLGIDVMIQEIIPGDDAQGVNYNSYIANGKVVAEFTARKVRIDPPIFGSPRVLVSEDVPEIVEPGRRLLQLLGYEGFSCMEFKRDARTGEYKLMEINARHNLSGALAPKCGVDFPWIMYRHVAHGELPAVTPSFQEGVYWIDLVKDLKRYFVSSAIERFTLRAYLKPYLRRKIFGIFSLRDPKPFATRIICFFRHPRQKAKYGAVQAKTRLAARLGLHANG